MVYEDKIEIYYNYTDETNPGDDSPRDPLYYSGSDSSVMVGSNPTNPNQNEKNYPKGSDSSVMVDTRVTCPNTRLKIIPEWFYRDRPLPAAYNSDSCSRSQSGRRKARFSVSDS